MAKAKNTELTSAFDLFNKSTEVVKRNLNNFAILMILPFLATLFSIFNTNNSSRGFSGSSTFAGLPTYAVFSLSAIGIILGIVIFVAALMIEAMTNVLKVEGAKGKTPNLKHLFEVGKKYWLRLFGFYIIYAVMLIVGFILLIVPGLIVLRRYSLVPYIIIDKNATIKEAMRESGRITKPHSGYIWSIYGVSLLIAIPSIIPYIGPLIAFVLGALYSVAFALRYEELKKL